MSNKIKHISKVIFTDEPDNFTPSFHSVSCICWIDDSFLCLRRNPEKKEGSKWGFPGGKVEKGEELETALRRELQEELSLEVPEISHVRSFFVRYPYMDFFFSVYETHFTKEPKMKINTNENSTYEWLTLKEFLKRRTVRGNDEIVRILYS